MRRSFAPWLLVAAALSLAGCKPQAPEPDTGSPTAAAPAADVASSAPDTAAPAIPEAAQSGDTQASFAGYGDMKLGSTVDEAKAAWGGELKGEPSEGSTCYYLTPKWVKKASDFAFMAEDGKFVRYDVGTDKEAAPGGGKVGMAVDELQKLYGNALQSSPHKYVEGGQYLSIAASGVAPSKLVFETDAAGKVTGWRVGLTPQVDYVEGCS
jgi:hypothetical protein